MRIFPKLKKLKLKKVPSFVVVVDVYKQKFNNENFVCLIKNCMRSIERILTKYKRVMERGEGVKNVPMLENFSIHWKLLSRQN